MKKRILGLFILVLLVITAGCTQSNLENYKSASIKTDSMTKGTETITININTDYNRDGLDEEALKIINTFDSAEFTLKNSFDSDINKSLSSGYLNFGDLGYDFKVYGLDNKTYIEPLFLNLKGKKYIELSDTYFTPDTDNSEALFDKIAAKWNEVINEENVIKGGNVLITTDDGEVKSREFTIDLKDEQLREFLLYMVETFQENDQYKKVFEEITYFKDEEVMTQEEKDELYEELLKEFKKFIEETDNLNFFYKAYIDIDGYIVQEDIRFGFGSETVSSGGLKSFEFKMTNMYSNIEKEQNLDFIEPSIEESISIDELDFESFMNPQKEGK